MRQADDGERANGDGVLRGLHQGHGGKEVKYILRKYVEAESAAQALKLDHKTPVHDLYLKDGEEPRQYNQTRAVGFSVPLETEDADA